MRNLHRLVALSMVSLGIGLGAAGCSDPGGDTPSDDASVVAPDAGTAGDAGPALDLDAGPGPRHDPAVVGTWRIALGFSLDHVFAGDGTMKELRDDVVTATGTWYTESGRLVWQTEKLRTSTDYAVSGSLIFEHQGRAIGPRVGLLGTWHFETVTETLDPTGNVTETTRRWHELTLRADGTARQVDAEDSPLPSITEGTWERSPARLTTNMPGPGGDFSERTYSLDGDIPSGMIRHRVPPQP